MYDVSRTVIGAEPVTVAELQAYIMNRYDSTDQDVSSLLQDMITSARELAEQYCNRSFVQQEIEYTENVKTSWSDDIPEFVLPFPNHLSIVEVKVNDVVPTHYQQGGINQYTIQFNGRWYTTSSTGTKFYFKYTAGACPGLAKQAIMQIAKDMYENRGVNPLSSNGFNLLNSLKVY